MYTLRETCFSCYPTFKQCTLFFSVIYTGAPVELLRPVLLCWTVVGPICAAPRPSLRGAGRTHAAPGSATVVRSPAGNNQRSLQQAHQCSHVTWMCRRSFKVGDIYDTLSSSIFFYFEALTFSAPLNSSSSFSVSSSVRFLSRSACLSRISRVYLSLRKASDSWTNAFCR